MKMKLYLCTDNTAFIQKIRLQLDTIRDKIPLPIDVCQYTDAGKMLDALRLPEEHCDVLIADIDMPSLSGMQLAQIVHKEGLDVLLIFLSSHPQYIYDSSEYVPFCYIRKEYMGLELLPALTAACSIVKEKTDISIVVRTKEEIIHLVTKDILCFKTENRKCIIYTIQNRQYETRYKIKYLYEKIAAKDNNFLKVHSGCVVNLRFVKAVTKTDLILEGDISLPFSRRKKKEITEAITKYWESVM